VRLWQRYETTARRAWDAALIRLRSLQADRRRAETETEPRSRSESPPPRRVRNEANPAIHPQSLYAQTGGMDPAPVIAALRQQLRDMASAGLAVRDRAAQQAAAETPPEPLRNEAKSAPEPHRAARKRAATALVTALAALGLLLGTTAEAGRSPAAPDRPPSSGDGRGAAFFSLPPFGGGPGWRDRWIGSLNDRSTPHSNPPRQGGRGPEWPDYQSL
jgi:hypothetical protein